MCLAFTFGVWQEIDQRVGSDGFLGWNSSTTHGSRLSTPFKVVYGRDPPTLMSYQPGLAKVVAVDKQLQDRDAFLREIRERLVHAQELMKQIHDKGHRHVEFAMGDWVWLRVRSATGITEKSNNKL